LDYLGAGALTPRRDVLMLALLRLALATCGVLLAIARGVDGMVTLLTAVFGAVVCGFAIVSTRQEMWRPGATGPSGPAWRFALRAAYPSTIALAALTALSLVLKPQLAALTAGLLAGLGFAALATAAQAESWRRFVARD
jgi:hypothetical protein